VSTSLGFETFDGSDLESLEELRRNAEVALRAAKRRGGNKGVYYRQPDSAEASAA
jgi:GGDEF domain-containing protein